MKINFILPSFPLCPIGGYKIMYEYANLFAENGYDVAVYHVMTLKYVSSYNIPHFLRVLRCKLLYPHASPDWFNLNTNIHSFHIPKLKNKYVRDADIVISTMYATALELNALSDKKGEKINFIQGYELWIADYKDLLYKSYCLPITHVVIADYLADIVENVSGKRPFVIYNGIDPSVFYINKPIEKRFSHSISMLYSEADNVKGTSWGLEALRICHQKVQDINIQLFGVYPRPKGLESWFQYHRRPENLRDIYNSVSIFLSPSVTEGWDLTSTEAMFCGCALICTDIPGHAVYAKNKRTCLLVSPKNSEDMAEKLLELLDNDNLRCSLAKSGNEFIHQFSSNISYKKMERLFKDVIMLNI
jgi:glycosyltransferase involved in cell wall biosynthesis